MPPLIAEELLVLGYDPDGNVRGDATRLDCALAGALVLQLILNGSVVADGDLLSPVTGAEELHPELASALSKIGTAQTTEAVIVALVPGLRRRLLADLVDRSALGDETHRWLGVLHRHRFPELDPALRDDALRRVRASADPRTLALAAMVIAAGLANKVWSTDGRRGVQQRVDGFRRGRLVSDAVAKAVRTMHARTMT